MNDPVRLLVLQRRADASKRGVLDLWTIYDHPKDFPHSFVARRFEFDKATDDIFGAGDLHQIRKVFDDCGLVCLMRNPNDDAKIVETWV